MIHKMWSDIGKPTPLLSLKVASHLCHSSVACHYLHLLGEGDYAGAYFGEPIDVVKCETSDPRGSGFG